jgi:hypothetical protein
VNIDKAFRHGDIENILENLVKNVGGPALGGGLLGFASSVFKTASGGSKFSKMDVKRVYFVCGLETPAIQISLSLNVVS